MLSEVRASQSRFGDAAAAIEEGWLKARDTMDPSSPLWLVELHLLAGDKAGASAALSRWSSTMSAGVRDAAEGRLAEADGDLARATTLYRKALEGDPLLVRVVQRLSDLNAAAGRFDGLEPFLVSTLEKHPHVDAYWDLAGQIAMLRRDADTASRRFRKAMELQPENGLYIGHFASSSAAA